MDFNKPIEIAKNIYWIGKYLDGDPFQCHPYMIVNGDESILVDPGSVLEFDDVVKKINSVISIKQIKYIILHHQDPDIAASVPALEKLIDRNELQIITHSRMSLLIKHYGVTSSYYEIDRENFFLKTVNGLELNFLTTPYCHSPGAFVTFEPNTKTLFSSDIFGGLEDSWKFYADENYFEYVKLFHETFMPSRNILNYSLKRIEEFDIELIAPQHGSIIQKEYIKPLIEDMKKLDCGLFIDNKYHAELLETTEKLDKEILRNIEKDAIVMEQSKLAQMGEMMNMIAHQWRQPLNAISASAINISLLNSIGTLEEGELDKSSTFIQQQTQKMSKTIDDFMSFSKESIVDDFLLYEAVENVRNLINAQIESKSIKLIFDLDREAKVYHNKTSVEHALMNFITNARDAFDECCENENKIIKVYIKTDDNSVSLCVLDNAGGIKKDIINKIFNPYFTTKDQGKGTGMGLYMTKKLIEEVKGSSLLLKTSKDKSLFYIKFLKR